GGPAGGGARRAPRRPSWSGILPHGYMRSRLRQPGIRPMTRPSTPSSAGRRRLEWDDRMAVNTTVQVILPAMGESVREGTILEWHKQEGEAVEADETLVEVSTDKVDAEIPA